MPVVEIPAPASSTTPFLLTQTLPFCPLQVSLHFRLANTEFVQVQGVFTHECQVPEPSMLVIFGMGTIGTVGVVVLRRRRANR